MPIRACALASKRWSKGATAVGRFIRCAPVVLLRRNMPPNVRRECAIWLPETLWLVARDGFWVARKARGCVKMSL